MTAISRQVTTNQTGLHPDVPRLVARHRSNPYRRPVAEHSALAFTTVLESLTRHTRPLVLDSFCGTGQSTAILAQRHPEHLVIGVDKSAHRLGRHTGGERDNYLLLRANCEDIWHLLLQQGMRVDFHYLLYPNPWPKAGHLRRRVHGHASFPWLLQLGGVIELRSNWQTYVEEFGMALHLAGRCGVVHSVTGEPPLTLFEKKYHRSGHPLWCYRSTRAAVTNVTE